MTKIEWDSVSDFERHPKLELKAGDSVNIKFEDDGTFVSKKQLADTGAKFPRDSYVFVVSVGNERKEFWVGSQSYSVTRQLKRLRERFGGNLKGAKASIKRVSDKLNETNYEIA